MATRLIIDCMKGGSTTEDYVQEIFPAIVPTLSEAQALTALLVKKGFLTQTDISAAVQG